MERSIPFKGGDDASRPSTAIFGSDVAIEMLRELEIPYVALNPGASFRGLHDSLVNFAGGGPEIILCPHEEVAVALAHGYARASGRPMAAIVHNIVGLQHASMAIFNAWCDRVPVLVLGGTGPMDATIRRPYIDWVHTALVQGNQVRDYTKWDDQPASSAAIPESLLRGHRIAVTEPRGPVYICFDSTLQEERLVQPITLPDVRRFSASTPPAADPGALAQAARMVVNAQWPLIIADTVGRNPQAVPALQELAELLSCGVIDKGAWFNFPNTHPLDLTLAEEEARARADVVLALDVPSLAGGVGGGRTRTAVQSRGGPRARIIHISLDDLLQHGWVADYQRLPEVDLPIAANTATAIPQLLELCRQELAANPEAAGRSAHRRVEIAHMHQRATDEAAVQVQQVWDLKPASGLRLYAELWEVIKDHDWALTSNSLLGPQRRVWELTKPYHDLSGVRGGGLGYSVAASIGMALAFKGTGRLCISITGDGDFLMAPTALWTAARYRVPVLFVVFNNRSYGNDEGHQEFMARERERNIENKGIGIRLDDPVTDFAALARSFGVAGFGPVEDPDELRSTFRQAVEVVTGGRPALVDVHTQLR